jgi:Heparinase II/III-like protein/Heparinase II/III N-terminus
VDEKSNPEILDCIRSLGKPLPQLVGPSKKLPSATAVRDLKLDIFGTETHLVPPLNWLQDPHGSRSWRYELHTFTWMKPLLLAHADDGNAEALIIARDLLKDWATTHMHGHDAEVSEFAWYDAAVGLRAPYVAYVLRACLIGNLLDDETAGLLLATAQRHGTELADATNYTAKSNHGLMQDEGLYLLALQLPPLPSSPEWSALAVRRLRETLWDTVSIAEGAHLEHSAAYQFAISNLVSRLAQNVGELPELNDLRERLRSTAAWQVTPAGRLVQLGDTDDRPAPKWAHEAASNLHGMNALFETGQVFVREGDSYLAVCAAHHSQWHKQADDTGFILFESGHIVLGDAGRWGYYEDEPDRLYARSAFSHNVLTVDGRDFDWRKTDPYGSGVDAVGEAEGWYVIATRNPLLARQGVDHHRILLYQPAQALIVLDQVHAEHQHEYTRYFHFGPELEAQLVGDRVALTGTSIVATLADASEQTEIELCHGQDSPQRLGWAYPADRERVEVSTAVLRSCASTASLVAVLGLGTQPTTVTAVEVGSEHAAIELDESLALEIHLEGQRAFLSCARLANKSSPLTGSPEL